MTDIVIKPRLSEKSYALSQSGVYVFDVPTDSNKHQIADAVSQTYEVEVVDVRVSVLKGKVKRLYRNRRWEKGARVDVKKAYVRIKEGQSIPVFAAVEESIEQEAKADKKSAKKAKKD